MPGMPLVFAFVVAQACSTLLAIYPLGELQPMLGLACSGPDGECGSASALGHCPGVGLSAAALGSAREPAKPAAAGASTLACKKWFRRTASQNTIKYNTMQSFMGNN